jgi:ABC-type polysaccharide/polyol phosphate export permease
MSSLTPPAAEDTPTPFLRSLEIQGRVIGALMMRELITRFGRHNLGVLWLVLEPMVFTLGVAAMWTALGRTHHSSLPIVAFAITGYSSVLVWRNTVSHCNGAIQGNINLLFHRNVRLFDVMLTRILLEISGATGSFAVLSLLFVSIGTIQPPTDLLKVVGGWLMLAWFGGSLALLVGTATAYGEIVKRIWSPISYMLFPASGAAFMVDWLPPQGQRVVLLLPMVHGVELVREGYFGDAVRTHYDIGYMATVNLVLTLAGLLLLRHAARRVESK